jgi:hypothetical protein
MPKSGTANQTVEILTPPFNIFHLSRDSEPLMNRTEKRFSHHLQRRQRNVADNATLQGDVPHKDTLLTAVHE